MIGCLLNFETTINDKYEKKIKSVVFKADVEEDDDQLEGNADENLIKSITLLAKKFGKVMRRFDKRSRSDVPNNVKEN